jgi:hypothetical protein
MGRAVRMVPANWQHPKDLKGSYIPLFDGFNNAVEVWDIENQKWGEGLVTDYSGGWRERNPSNTVSETYSDYAGDRPKQEDYMPDFPISERTHYMMYEDTSEGTPLSPACETPEILASWLANNNASAFGKDTASYDQWLAMIKSKWSVGAVFTPETGLISGVEATTLLRKE